MQTPLDIAKKEKKQDLIEILERRINVEELSTYTAFQGSEDDKEQPKSIPFIRLGILYHNYLLKYFFLKIILSTTKIYN